MYKDGKWARELIAAQRPDGSWGWFHTLSAPRSSSALTTEQSIRRLAILGYTYEDAPMRLAIDHLRACLCSTPVMVPIAEQTLRPAKIRRAEFPFSIYIVVQEKKPVVTAAFS